jgi:rare lipoprotein A
MTTIRFAAFAALLTSMMLLSACGHSPAPRRSEQGLSYTATASWYGPDFHGRRTASGEVYDMYGLTAAHKTFPFGTKLRVTYIRTGDSVVVTVNDRGPFVSGRDLDLSRGAADEIGMLVDGVGEVYIEILKRDMRYVKYLKSGTVGEPATIPVKYEPGMQFRVQVGAFTDPLNAEHLSRGLKLGYDDVRVQTVEVKGVIFHRVQVGIFDTRDDAIGLAETLANEGYETMIFTGR